jgi:hypothetical protein
LGTVPVLHCAFICFPFLDPLFFQPKSSMIDPRKGTAASNLVRVEKEDLVNLVVPDQSCCYICDLCIV